MRVVFAAVGAVIGVLLGAYSAELLGAVAGALFAWILITQARQVADSRRHDASPARADVAQEVDQPPAAPAPGTVKDPWAPPATSSARSSQPSADTTSKAAKPVGLPPDGPTVTSSPDRPETDGAQVPAAARAPDTGVAHRPTAPAPNTTDSREAVRNGEAGNWLGRALTWLVTGNVPVKVGVIVSFFGAGFFLKYAVDQGLFSFPIEWRLGGVATFGLALLAFGWRLRQRVPVYALSLQGGGVGILYLTAFAALRFYAVLPVTATFAALVLVTVVAGVLAVIQNARTLAVLGIAGGFLAPILVSTGSGNHVMLFSYYLVLNAGILAIAWYRAWRELNLLGFVFTFVIGGLWGWDNYQATLFASTEPFLIAFFAFYHGVGILYALRQPPNLKGLIDGTLIFGTPVVVFALQSRLVAPFEYGLAWTAASLAGVYLFTALGLRGLGGQRLELLTKAYGALSLAFATLAIPLALDPRWTSAAWALEGAAMIWVGTRQQRLLIRLSGVALVLGAGIAFMWDGWMAGRGPVILNANFLGGILIALASMVSARQLEGARGRATGLLRLCGVGLFYWGVLWWICSGILEIEDRALDLLQPSLLTGYLTLTALGLLALARILEWRQPRLSVLGFLAALLLPAMMAAIENGHLLAQFGWIAWPVAFATQYFVLWCLRGRNQTVLGAHHHLTFIALVLAIMWETGWQLDHAGLATLWVSLGVAAVPGLAYLLVCGLIRAGRGPFATHATTIMAALGLLSGLQLLILAALNLESSGTAPPLPYLPLLNPLDIASALTLLQVLHWLWRMRATRAWPAPAAFRLCMVMVAAVALGMSTMAVVRAVHHLAGVPWDVDVLLQSVIVQAALSIFWGVLGLAGMVWGARAARRNLWLCGAGLMAIVVIKLFLVDLGNTGTIERVISFVGTGLLLLIVGYLAPVPPRDRGPTDEPLDTRL